MAPTRRGQSVTEYSLVIGLVVMASLLALSSFGPTLSNQMAAALGADAVSPTSILPNPGGGTGNGGTTPPPKVITDLASKILMDDLCLNASLCVKIPRIPPGGASVADVVGNLGGDLIQKYGNVLDDLIAQLKTDPSITDADLAELVALAQSGHGLGENLTNLAGGCPNGKGCTAALPIGSGHPQDPIGARQSFSDQLAKVQQAFATKLNSKVPPSTQNLVNALAQQMITIHAGAINVDSSGNANHVVEETNDAQLLHIDANTLCGTGTQQTSQCTVTLKG